MSELISVAQAEALIRAEVIDAGSERIALDEAAGRVLRQVVRAERDQPPFDRVMMDGIAVRHTAAPPATGWNVRGAQLAGQAGMRLGEDDDCLEVTTGAMLPDHADTVLPIEQLEPAGETRLRLRDGYAVAQGQFVHRRGSDCLAGAALLHPGQRLNAPSIAVLAANGVAQVEVSRIPAIALVSTGDELVDVDAPLQAWQIRRSNDRALAAALRQRGFNRLSHALAPDRLADTVAVLDRLLGEHAVVVLSGGVSMGSRDYVPAALRQLGVRQVFHKVAQRPGKPLWFGVGKAGQLVFGLPGNPVSALACGVRYVLPALLASQGLAEPGAAGAGVPVMLESAARTPAALSCFMPVRLRRDEQGRVLAQPRPSNTSGDFSGLAGTDGFIELPAGPGAFTQGYVAPFYAW